jgi:hypothetical protein
MADTAAAAEEAAAGVLADAPAEPRPEVVLTDFDPEGEIKVVGSALYEAGDLPDDQALAAARRLPVEERERILTAYVGRRTNRRHRPGRAFERTAYRFDILCDYGAFRDLQRHRLLTMQWQRLTPGHGFALPVEIEEIGGAADWAEVMEASASLHRDVTASFGADVAQYAVAMAYRVRFVMDMNAREAMHVIELRTTPQGHPVYRRVCQQMHRLIRDEAGHRAIAAAMGFVDHSGGEVGRLQAERRTEAKRQALLAAGAQAGEGPVA